MLDPGYHGVFPYLVSPLDEAGRVKRDVLAALVERLIGAGVHGLTPLGSTGEFAYLTRDQRLEIVDTVVRAARGRVPVVAGVAATTTRDAVDLAREVVRLGADGVLAIMEAYFPIADAGVEAYFRAVAEAVSCPVVLYTNPQFQRSDLSLAVIRRLSEVANIRYLKDASTNTGRLLSIIEETGGRLKVFAASAHIPACVMLIGGVGWMAGPACIIPEQSVALYGSRAPVNGTRRWRFSASSGGQPGLRQICARACIKAALEMQGFDVGAPIPPQAPLGDDERRDLRAVLDDLGAL